MKTKQTDEWKLETWPDGHTCEKRYVDGQYTGDFRNVTAALAQAQHSPLPWKIDEAEDLPLAIIEDTEDGYGVCELEFPDTEQAKANAAYIVRACNNAQRLADALDKIETRIMERGSDSESCICDVLDVAREALAEWSKHVA